MKKILTYNIWNNIRKSCIIKTQDFLLKKNLILKKNKNYRYFTLSIYYVNKKQKVLKLLNRKYQKIIILLNVLVISIIILKFTINNRSKKIY